MRRVLGVLLFWPLAAACEDPFFVLYDGGVAIDAGTVDAGAPSPCNTLTPAMLSFPAKGGTFAEISQGSSVLFASATDPLRFFSASIDSVTERTNYVMPDNFKPIGSYLRGDQIYFGGRDGTLAVGPADGSAPFTRLSTATVGREIHFVTTSPPSASLLEIYVISQDDDRSELFRYENGRFEFIIGRDFVPNPFNGEDRAFGAIVWNGPEDIYAVMPHPHMPHCLVSYKRMTPDHVVINEITDPAMGVITTLVKLNDKQILAGTHQGELLAYDGLVWMMYQSPLIERAGPIVRSIIPEPHGFISFTDFDTVEYFDGSGFCAPVANPMGLFSYVSAAAKVDHGWVVAGPTDLERDGTVMSLRSDPP